MFEMRRPDVAKNVPSGQLTRRVVLQRAGLTAVGLSGLPALLSACSNGEKGPLNVASIDWAQSSGPPDMNPLRRFDVQGSMVLALGLQGLLAFDRDFQLVPALATDFGPSRDLTKWTFKVRKGVLFSDGSEMSIDDVLYCYEQHLSNPQSAFGFFYDVVDGVRVQGDDLIVDLRRPDSIFGYTAAHTAGFIWQKSSAERMGKSFGTPGNLPVGTGPYTFLEYVQNDKVTLGPNEHYSGESPAVKEISVRTVPDDSSRLLSLRAGQIQGTFDVPPEQLNQWKDLENGNVDEAPGLGVAYLSFNVTQAPFDDIHVRKAFAYALDREGLVRSAIQGAGQVATAFVSPPFWTALGMSPEQVLERYSSFAQYDFDLSRAEAELKSSAHAAGLQVKVNYPSSYQRLGKLLLNLKENLSTIGVSLEVGQITEDEWFSELYEGRKETVMQVGFYRPDYPDPANYASFFATSQIEGGNNFGMYSNPEVDELLNLQSTTTDSEERIAPLMRVMEIVAADAVVAPVWWESSLLGTSSDITAYTDPVWYLNPWATTVKPA